MSSAWEAHEQPGGSSSAAVWQRLGSTLEDMTNIYTYRVETYSKGLWRTRIRAEMKSGRDPKSFARGLLEQWIIGQRRPPSGRVVVAGRRRAGRDDGTAMVRVRVYPGRLDNRDPASPALRPAAIAYLTSLERDRIGAAA